MFILAGSWVVVTLSIDCSIEVGKQQHVHIFEFNIIKHNLILCIFAFIYDQYLSTTISLNFKY
jgi:hypothetical protein